MNLTPVSRAMTDQALVSGGHDNYPDVGGEEEREDRRSALMRRGFVVLFAALVFIIVMGVGGDEVARVNKPLGQLMNAFAGLGAAALLAGVGLIVYSGLLPALKRRRPAGPRAISPPPAAVDYSGTPVNTASMDPRADPQAESAPSVTEHTTYTLGAQKPDAPSQ